MKIAVLSDIHGNLPALEVVAAHVQKWQPDKVIVNGDTVNRGPSSLAAWQFVMQQPGWQLLNGNHEAYVVGHNNGDSGRENGRLFEINYMSYWTYLQLNNNVGALDCLPDGLSLFAPDGSELRIRHGSMNHNRDGIWPDSEKEYVQKQLGKPPAVFATAHIHLPFVRTVGKTLVVNSGSVGTPADGDTRASYAQIVWQSGKWVANIVRLPFDRRRTIRDYETSGFLAEAGPVGWLVYHEWEQASGILYPWLRTYFDKVMSGEIGLETAVTQYISNLGLHLPI